MSNNTITTENLTFITELPAKLSGHKATRYGAANDSLENAITAAYPAFTNLNSLTRENILDALFTMRGEVVGALNAGGEEIAKLPAA